LTAKRQQLLEEQKELTGKVEEVKQKIKKQQEHDNPVVRQLREHFKALREEMRQMVVEEDE
jgi:hypothetical protein